MKSYTDLNQSKKLADILPIESADMWYWEFPTAPTYNDYGYPMFHKGEGIRNVPCWSLAALLDILPSGKALVHIKGMSFGYKCICKNIDTVFYNNSVDACVEMIMRLHELKML